MAAKQVSIMSVIVITEKGLSPAIATLGHMMGKTRNDNTRQPRHVLPLTSMN
jgi:hypothetical protein